MCMPEAAIPIKSYSPDLMVRSTLTESITDASDTQLQPLLRCHSTVIGPVGYRRICSRC